MDANSLVSPSRDQNEAAVSRPPALTSARPGRRRPKIIPVLPLETIPTSPTSPFGSLTPWFFFQVGAPAGRCAIPRARCPARARYPPPEKFENECPGRTPERKWPGTREYPHPSKIENECAGQELDRKPAEGGEGSPPNFSGFLTSKIRGWYRGPSATPDLASFHRPPK